MRGIHEIDEQIKKTRHDLKKHLQSLNGYLYSEIPDIEGMRRYLAEYTQRTLILGDMVYTDSIVVNYPKCKIDVLQGKRNTDRGICMPEVKTDIRSRYV